MSRSILRAILTASLAAGVPFVLSVPGYADPGTDLYEEQEQVDREVATASAALEDATERVQEAAAEFTAADAALPAAEARVDETRGKVIAATVRLETAEREETEAAEELAAASDRFDESVAAVADARTDVATFAAAAYQGGGLASANVMLGARGPADAVERLGYLGQIGDAKQEAVEGLLSARLGARQAENEATLAHQQAEQARRTAAVALAKAEAAKEEAEDAVAAAEDLADSRAEALEVAEEEREETLRRFEAAEADAEQIESDLQEWDTAQTANSDPPRTASSSSSSSSSSSGALLLTPTEGWMSSPYGMRQDPFYGTTRLHAGMDIAAPGGTPIYAARDGTVVQAGWYGGYGNYTCLSHGSHQGQALTTCYAHQSEILVSIDQWVAEGDLIGRVGTTGSSTGNHLHFEVRLDGSPTNPVPYLP